MAVRTARAFLTFTNTSWKIPIRHHASGIRHHAATAQRTAEAYETLIVETRGTKKNVGYIQLHLPKQHNIISTKVSKELWRAFDQFDNDDNVGAIVYSGGERIFTVGANVKEMVDFTFPEVFLTDFSLFWNRIHECRKPVIAAVNGYCVGGGIETSMMCDIIYAGESAQFGQPEIFIGILPGSGGTQRLTKAIGKSKSMELILAGERISARQAEEIGLISKVFPNDKVIPEAIKLAENIASKPRVAVMMAKEAVKAADETGLTAGFRAEKMLSLMAPATHDFKEGMRAFIEKRKPVFTD